MAGCRRQVAGLHLAIIVFVVVGGLLAWRDRRLALIYPHGLTRPVQFALAALVLGCNALVYPPLLLRLRRGHR